MDADALFDRGRDDAARQTQAPPPRIGLKRLRGAVRNQIEFQQCSLDELLPEEHEARIVWEYVGGLDLSQLRQRIQAVEGGRGQAPADPRILLALWLYATLRGVGSARELNRLCQQHVAYRWICGGVSMNYHTLADFRTQHVELLDRLLTESVASLMAEGLVTLDRVAQDGMKVRASAGAASFRRQATLEEALAAAEQQVAKLRQELETDPAASKTRQQAARQRAAEQRAERIRAALEQLPKIAESKKAKDRPNARASTTDADARVMKMVDGGFVKKADIDHVSPPQGGTTVYAPVMESKDPQRDPHTPRDDDSPAVAEWRQRMAGDEAKAIYRERASTAECVNALARNRGLQRFLVRGLQKVKAVALWYALAHNLMRAAALRAAACSMMTCSG